MSRVKSKLFLIVLVFSISLGVFSSESVARRRELIKVIDMQISEIVRIGRSVSSNPRYLLQLAELNLEKARHLKDLENERFLRMPESKTRKINRARFFKNSRKYVQKAENYCRNIIKNFPRYPYKGDVYYIMAFNAKEFGRYTTAQQYFAKASKERSSDPNIKLKAHIALADILYNQTKFKKAAKHYEIGLRKKIDQWWTKDAFNLAWCYYQTRNYNKGIKLLLEVVNRSKSKQYIDMSDQASRDLARFYVQAGRIDEAVRYYKQNFSDAGKKLTELGEYLIGQSKLTKAIPILEEALGLVETDKQLVKRARMALLKSYDKFGRYSKQLETSQALMEMYISRQLSKSEQKLYRFYVKSGFAKTQRVVSGKIYQSRPKKRRYLSGLVAEFAKLMKKIEPRKEIAYSYLTAEAFYQSKDYDTAVTYYKESLALAKRVKHKKYIKLSLDGVAACLQHSKNDTDGSKLAAIYDGYLTLNPRNKKAYTIYQRLFNQQMKHNNAAAAEKTLMTFKKYFPRDRKKSEAMLAQLMDHYLKKEDKVNFSRLFKMVSTGKIAVSGKYARQLKKVALGLQFQDVQKASSEGEKKKALLLYVGIYRDKNSSIEAKKNAAYNIMRMFYLLGDAKRMYQWADRALKHMNKRDVLKFQTSFSKLALELFERRRFDYAFDLYNKIDRRLCGTGATLVNDGFNNMIVILLSKNRLNTKDNLKINRLISRAPKCGVNRRIINQIRIDLIKRYIENRSWKSAYKHFKILSKTKKNWNKLIAPAYTLYKKLGYRSLRKLTNKFFDDSIRRGKPVDINAANSIFHLRSGTFYSKVRSFNNIKLRFPEKRFNRALEKKFKLLATMMTSGITLVNLGSSDGVVEVYTTLITSYGKFIKELQHFTPPKKSAGFIKSFKQSMGGVISALQTKQNEIYMNARNLISKHEILNSKNLFFYPNYDSTVRYSSIYSGLIMDRGGLK